MGRHLSGKSEREDMQPDIVLRWTARIWSIASTLFILAFLLPGEQFGKPTASEAVALLLFPVGVLLGFVIAWRREGLGGAITVGSLALFYIWMIALDGRLPSGPYFLLLAAPGFLYVASALLRRSPDSRSASNAT
jgi:hypothetical protein